MAVSRSMRLFVVTVHANQVDQQNDDGKEQHGILRRVYISSRCHTNNKPNDSREQSPGKRRIDLSAPVPRTDNQAKYPDFHNAPVESFGPLNARVLIVGLAPGLKGANRTGRPFTGDWAGDLLYPTLLKFGLAQGTYG